MGGRLASEAEIEDAEEVQVKPDPTLEQRIEDLKVGIEKALQHLLENDPPSLARITLQQTLNKDKPW